MHIINKHYNAQCYTIKGTFCILYMKNLYQHCIYMYVTYNKDSTVITETSIISNKTNNNKTASKVFPISIRFSCTQVAIPLIMVLKFVATKGTAKVLQLDMTVGNGCVKCGCSQYNIIIHVHCPLLTVDMLPCIYTIITSVWKLLLSLDHKLAFNTYHNLASLNECLATRYTHNIIYTLLIYVPCYSWKNNYRK